MSAEGPDWSAVYKDPVAYQLAMQNMIPKPFTLPYVPPIPGLNRKQLKYYSDLLSISDILKYDQYKDPNGYSDVGSAVKKLRDAQIFLVKRAFDNISRDRKEGNIEREQGHWSKWQDMGSGNSTIPKIRLSHDKRMELFFNSLEGQRQGIYHGWQVAPNSGWSHIEKRASSDSKGYLLEFADFSCGINADGRLELFALGREVFNGRYGKYGEKSYNLYKLYQHTAAGSWGQSWELMENRIPLNFFRFDSEAAPKIEYFHDGRMQLYLRGSNDRLYFTHQNAPNEGWKEWTELGTGIKDFTTGRNKDGRIDVFARARSNNEIYNRGQRNESEWSNWHHLGGNLCDIPEVGYNEDGRMELFGRAKNGSLISRCQVNSNEGNWYDWHELSKDIFSYWAKPKVITNRWGCIELFIEGVNGKLLHLFQLAQNTGFSHFVEHTEQEIGGIWGINLEKNEDGRIEIFARDTNGKMIHKYQY